MAKATCDGLTCETFCCDAAAGDAAHTESGEIAFVDGESAEVALSCTNELISMGESEADKIADEVYPDLEVIHFLNAVSCGMIAVDGHGASAVIVAGDVIEVGCAME